MQQFRLIGVTVLLTCMIWMAADFSLTDTLTIKLVINPYSSIENTKVLDIAETQRECEAQVTGKRVVVERLRQAEPLSIRLPVTQRSLGRTEIDLRDALSKLEGELGEVVIQETRPSTMVVSIDRDIAVNMPVTIRPATLEYEGPVVIDPREVAVTLSELAYNQLEAEDRRIWLDLDEHLQTAPRGVAREDRVPLRPMVGILDVQLDPDFVEVRYKLAEQLKEMTISAVPIKIEASLDLFNSFRVEVRDAGTILTQPITIRARQEMLDRIRNDEIRLLGVLVLTASDKANPGQYRYLTPRFNLPEGVTLTAEPDPIEFRLVPIDQPANPS